MAKQRVPLHTGRLLGKTIIALDLGRRCGWSVLKSGLERGRDSGVFELYSETPGAEFSDGERFAALGRFLTSLDDVLEGAAVVVFEQVHPMTHKSVRQTQLYNGMRGIVMEWAARLGKKCYPIPVQTIKKSIAGNGGASKQEVINAVVELGYLPFDDNEADAIAALHTAIRASDTPGVLDGLVLTAEQMQLGQFKTGAKVVVLPRKRIGDKATAKKPHTTTKKTLTLPSVARTMDDITSNMVIKECSSDSAACALPAKRRRRKSSSKTSDSTKPSSPRP